MELDDVVIRIWQDVLARPTGPFGMRFAIQPIVAAALAMRDGARDARARHTPYFWTIVTDRTQRANLLKEGFVAVAKVLLIALILEAIYQVVVLEAFYPVEALIVVLTLAYVPYMLTRGPAERIVRWWIQRQTPTERLQP